MGRIRRALSAASAVGRIPPAPSVGLAVGRIPRDPSEALVVDRIRRDLWAGLADAATASGCCVRWCGGRGRFIVLGKRPRVAAARQ